MIDKILHYQALIKEKGLLIKFLCFYIRKFKAKNPMKSLNFTSSEINIYKNKELKITRYGFIYLLNYNIT